MPRGFPVCVLCVALVLASSSLPVCARGGAQAGRRESKAIDAGEVLVVVNEQLLNALLEGMLAFDNPPTFALSRGGEGRQRGGSSSSSCASEVTLVRESQGHRTAVRFAEGRIDVPVAFRGSYDTPLLGCLKFEGWADAALDLAFDEARQVLKARVNVRAIHLKNIPPMLAGGVTQLVQEAIDRRINPIELLRAEQLGARLNVSPGNSLRLRARSVRHEVLQKELRLRIAYEVVRGE